MKIRARVNYFRNGEERERNPDSKRSSDLRKKIKGDLPDLDWVIPCIFMAIDGKQGDRKI